MCGGQAGGGERGELGEHHHEQCSEGADRTPQAEDGDPQSGQGARHPLLQGEDHLVRH